MPDISVLDVLVALAIAVGIVGVVVPILPGTTLVAAAILLWAFQTSGSTVWTVAAIALSLLLVGAVVKYAVPGRQLTRSGVPMPSLLAGSLLGVVGFFVLPVIGIVVGFVAGLYAAEARRIGPAAARNTTTAAIRAVGLSILIELAAALLAAFTWVVGVTLT